MEGELGFGEKDLGVRIRSICGVVMIMVVSQCLERAMETTVGIYWSGTMMAVDLMLRKMTLDCWLGLIDSNMNERVWKVLRVKNRWLSDYV